MRTYTEIKKLIEEKDLKSIEKLSQDELSSRDLTTAETLLHVAASEGYLEIVKLLCANGCSIYDHDNAYYLPIHYAAADNRSEVVKWFLEQSKGNLINNKGDYHYTPLHMAAENDAIKAMICLIEQGANLKSKDQGSRTPLDIFLTNNPSFCSYFSDYD